MRTLYVCYFGLREPLVQTQVLPYLRQVQREGLAVSLLTFEPAALATWPAGEAQRWETRLREEGITWRARRYHKRPTLPATLYDIAVGVITIVRWHWRERLDVLHARSYVAALTAQLACLFTGSKLLFDIRGLMAEEYVDAGSWPAGGLLYRLTKAAERWLLRSAHGFVVLTQQARMLLFPTAVGTKEDITGESAMQGRPIAVIPCCVDVAQFRLAETAEREQVRQALGVAGRRVVIYVGSLGGWYLTEETLALFEAARRQDSTTFALILTPRDVAQVELGPDERRGLTEMNGEGEAVTGIALQRHAEVSRYLAAADIALSLIKPCYSKQASSPTKIAEYLACGVPVISTAGIGDLDALFARVSVGVILRGFTEADYVVALQALDAMRAAPELRARCRLVAVTEFDLERVGGKRYRRLYQRLLAPANTQVFEAPQPAASPERATD